MPRYFFDTVDGDIDTDVEGVNLPGDDDAVRETILYAGGLISDQPSLLSAKSELIVTCRSDSRIVAQLRIELTRPAAA